MNNKGIGWIILAVVAVITVILAIAAVVAYNSMRESAEILGNPLFVPLLVAILTILTTAYFNYWLRKWQYRREYVISNVEKTYIPILAEINEKLDGFDKFLENPNGLDSTFAEMEKIRLSGLFEFVRSHDKKLHSNLELFYCKIYPRFRELSRLWFEFPRFIVSEWGTT